MGWCGVKLYKMAMSLVRVADGFSSNVREHRLKLVETT